MSFIRTGSYNTQQINTKAVRPEGLKAYKDAEFSHISSVKQCIYSGSNNMIMAASSQGCRSGPINAIFWRRNPARRVNGKGSPEHLTE